MKLEISKVRSLQLAVLLLLVASLLIACGGPTEAPAEEQPESPLEQAVSPLAQPISPLDQPASPLETPGD
jgi:outer membrane biogenesis lipoprotein LolB